MYKKENTIIINFCHYNHDSLKLCEIYQSQEKISMTFATTQLLVDFINTFKSFCNYDITSFSCPDGYYVNDNVINPDVPNARLAGGVFAVEFTDSRKCHIYVPQVILYNELLNIGLLLKLQSYIDLSGTPLTVKSVFVPQEV